MKHASNETNYIQRPDISKTTSIILKFVYIKKINYYVQPPKLLLDTK